MAALFRVKALYEYSSPHEDDLKFDAGQVIAVTDEEDADWYGGEYVDDNGLKKEGIFPRNFVEKFEPVAPPRPTRLRPKQEPEAPPEVQPPEETVAQRPQPPPLPAQEERAPAPAAEPATEEAEEPVHQSQPAEQPAPASAPALAPAAVPPSAPVPVPAPTSPKPRDFPAPPAPARAGSVPKPKPAPPPVSEKPNSFKDRIAAFNKSAAPPIAPFKPTSLGGGVGGGGGGGALGFIKKPFVAPPPMRNAFVPPPREAPVSRIYRREEDPEIQEQVAENVGQAEKVGLLPDSQPQGNDEDQPKPTSLKERIALLQKQQMEQAQRHADAVAKKEKPKKPPKKPLSPPAPVEAGEGSEALSASQTLERKDTEESGIRTSIDDTQSVQAPPPLPQLPQLPRLPPLPPLRQSDGNEADISGAGDTTEGQDDTTEREDSDETSKHISRVPTASTIVHRDDAEQAEEQEEEGEEEEDVDPEARRREELRARMAKMSGGMGFHGMFGAPISPLGAAPPKKKAPKPPAKPPVSRGEDSTALPRAPPVPTLMALPGMGGPIKVEETTQSDEDEPEQTPQASSDHPGLVPPTAGDQLEEEDVEEEETPLVDTPEEVLLEDTNSPPPPVPEEVSAPPVPSEARPPPPPVPPQARPPPPVPAAARSATEGSESDDELSSGAREKTVQETAAAAATRPPPPLPPQPLQITALPTRSPPLSPRLDAFLPSSPLARRASRPPPPIPGSAPVLPLLQTRPPPPPPPAGLSWQSTAEVSTTSPTRQLQAGEGIGEVTEYEGDYDTDIASSVPHKDALRIHERESSFGDNSIQSPASDAPPNTPPPVPTASTPRAAPPPVPMSPERKRKSADAPRGAPPPLPPPLPPKPASPKQGEEIFDQSYVPAPGILGSSYSQKSPKMEDIPFFPGVPRAKSPPERRIPPTALGGRPPRQSVDGHRASMSASRRSIEHHRPSLESDFIAGDIDLAVQSGWWKQANQVPPVLQGRKDIYFEFDESTSTNQGEKTIVARETFVLFQDYSQTIFTARYDPYNPSDVELEQRHEAPPRGLRQDQMEEAYDRFGRRISAAALLKKDQIVGDGTPQSFILELIRPLKEALRPVSSRSFGALVYSNMANASTQQHDIIRPGDIITIRNGRFQGKHGPMHAKYSIEVGKPDHVAVVAEWDGTKKKVRAWEQGRDSKKVKMESYKLDDLRSGEVKIWRVVSRSWVGWQRKSP